MSDITELIIEAILPHITCRHDEDRDEDGNHHWIEYDIDDKGKEKIEQILSQEK